MGSLTRIRLGLLAAVAYTIWTQVSLQRVVRPAFGGSPYFEDTAAGDGTRWRVLRRAAATRGAFVTVEALIRPGAPGWFPDHAGSQPLHSRGQAVTIAVREGSMVYVTGEGRRPAKASAGETVTVPAGEAYSYHNPSKEEPLLIELVIAPAPPLGEAFFESLAGLTQTYGGVRAVPPLQMVKLLSDAGIRLRGVSKPFAFAAEKVLPHVARIVGYKSVYPEYASGAATAEDLAARAPRHEPRSEHHTEL